MREDVERDKGRSEETGRKTTTKKKKNRYGKRKRNRVGNK